MSQHYERKCGVTNELISICGCWHCHINRIIDDIYKKLDKIENELKVKK